MKTRVRFKNPYNNDPDDHQIQIANIVANTFCVMGQIPPSLTIDEKGREIWKIAGSWALVFDPVEKDVFSIEGIPCFTNDHKDSQAQINALHRWLVFNPNIDGVVEEIPEADEHICPFCVRWMKRRGI